MMRTRDALYRSFCNHCCTNISVGDKIAWTWNLVPSLCSSFYHIKCYIGKLAIEKSMKGTVEDVRLEEMQYHTTWLIGLIKEEKNKKLVRLMKQAVKNFNKEIVCRSNPAIMTKRPIRCIYVSSKQQGCLTIVKKERQLCDEHQYLVDNESFGVRRQNFF